MVANKKYSNEDKKYFYIKGVQYDDYKKHYYCDLCNKCITQPDIHVGYDKTHIQNYNIFRQNHIYEIKEQSDNLLSQTVSYDCDEKKYYCFCCNEFTINPFHHISEENHIKQNRIHLRNINNNDE